MVRTAVYLLALDIITVDAAPPALALALALALAPAPALVILEFDE